MQELRAPTSPDPFEDRSARLTLFGSLAILGGIACAGLGLLHALLPIVASSLPGAGSLPADASTYVMGAALYVLLGAAFICVGVGSIRKRRWARPLMLTLAWTWLLSGVCVLLLLPVLLPAVLASGMSAVDPAVAGVVRAVLMGGTMLGGVILPAFFVWVYRDRDLQRTCEAHDPTPDWTERCPSAVLGLSLGLGICGVILALTALRPAVPWFGRLLTGVPGALVSLAAAVACVGLAWDTYALRLRGWWASTAFLVLVGLSTWLTVRRTEPSEMFRVLGYPEEVLPGSLSDLGPILAWLTLVLTVLTVVYMLAIRKHFGPRERTPD